MKKAGASNRDKNRIRKMHKEGFSVEQISALTSVRVEHVRAIVKRLNESGVLLYTTGKSSKSSGGGGLGGFEDGAPGEVQEIDQRAAELNVQQHHEEEVAALKKRNEDQAAELAELKKNAGTPANGLRRRRTKEQIAADKAAEQDAVT